MRFRQEYFDQVVFDQLAPQRGRGHFPEDGAVGATRLNFAGEDLRQLFVEALHPELVQVDLRQLGAEFPARDGIKLNVRGTNGRLIMKRVGKVENLAPRHFRTPGFPEAEKITRPHQGGDAASGDFLLTIAWSYFAGRSVLRET
jgi:hypothetical protein